MIRYFALDNNQIIPSKEYDYQKIIWCDLHQPTDTELMRISENFHVNLSDLEDCLDETERPRFSFDLVLQNHFLVFRAVQSYDDKLEKNSTVPIGLFFTSDQKIITIHMVKPLNLESVFDHLNRLKVDSSLKLYLEIIHYQIEQMDYINQKIAQNLRYIQKTIVSSQNTESIQYAFQLNAYIILFNTTLLGNQNAIRGMSHKVFQGDLSVMEKIEEMQTDIDQAYTVSSIHRDLLNSALDAFASVINNNLTHVMKVVGSLTLILMFPTLIASYYGMNVALPGGIEPGSHWSFYLILGVSVVSCVLLYILFRKKGWL